MKEIGRGAIGVQGDIAKLADLERLYASIQDEQGKLDIVFANAGISGVAPLGTIDETHFELIFGANVRGTIFTVQNALPLMKNGATVVLCGSGSGGKGFPNQTVYNASKAAIRSLARKWTSELKGRGIRVNVPSPGLTHSPAMRAFMGGETEAAEARIADYSQLVPLGRLADAAETATAALFLASDDSSYVAGVELFVDGGLVSI